MQKTKLSKNETTKTLLLPFRFIPRSTLQHMETLHSSPSTMIRTSFQLSRDQSSNSLIQPNFSNLIVATFVKVLWEVRSSSTTLIARQRELYVLCGVTEREEGRNLRSTVVDFTMRIEVRSRQESSFIGVKVEDNVTFDEEIDSNRTSTPERIQRKKRVSLVPPFQLQVHERDSRDLRPHMFVTFTMLTLFLSRHTAKALTTHQFTTQQTKCRILGALFAPSTFAFECRSDQGVEVVRESEEFVED